MRFLGLAVALALAALPALNPDLASAQAGAQTYTVNSPADGSDTNPGDGTCRSFGGQCTLRAAIEESNAHPGLDTIKILPGTYELEIPTINEDSDSSGDFDIRDSVAIVGTAATGVDATIIDGGFPPDGSPIEQRGMDRLFEIHPTALHVTFSKLTMREGFSDDAGAAIQNWSPGRVRVEDSRLIDNLASKTGGGINQAEPSDYSCPLCIPTLLPPGVRRRPARSVRPPRPDPGARRIRPGLERDRQPG
jgi:CSLREA domain-containing protein